LIDNEAQSPVFGEERQAMPAQVRVDPSLRKALDLARSHLLPELWQRNAEALGDHGRVDLNGAVAEFDRFHDTPRAGFCLDRAG
jgi:hypothetical protein